jgi:hypothetical protein
LLLILQSVYLDTPVCLAMPVCPDAPVCPDPDAPVCPDTHKSKYWTFWSILNLHLT